MIDYPSLLDAYETACDGISGKTPNPTVVDDYFQFLVDFEYPSNDYERAIVVQCARAVVIKADQADQANATRFFSYKSFAGFADKYNDFLKDMGNYKATVENGTELVERLLAHYKRLSPPEFERWLMLERLSSRF